MHWLSPRQAMVSTTLYRVNEILLRPYCIHGTNKQNDILKTWNKFNSRASRKMYIFRRKPTFKIRIKFPIFNILLYMFFFYFEF